MSDLVVLTLVTASLTHRRIPITRVGSKVVTARNRRYTVRAPYPYHSEDYIVVSCKRSLDLDMDL